MSFFSNRTVNLLNVHLALLGLLDQALGLFGPIYYYKQGFSIPEIFGLFAAFNVARIPLRLLSFPLVHRLGIKKALMVGTAGYALSFPLLTMVDGYTVWLFVYILMFGMFNALQWHCYHVYYTLAGEAEHRGKQVAVGASLSMGLAALAPVFSALVITYGGFSIFFLLPLPFVLVMLYVLTKCQDFPVVRRPWKEGKALLFTLGAKIHIAEASAVFPLHIGWVFAVYLYVEKLVLLGAIVAFGIIIQILYQMWIGKIIDKGKGHSVTHAAGLLRLLQIIGKSFVPLSYPAVLSMEAVSGATSAHHALAQPTAMYNAGSASADPFWYWLFAETAFDIGTVIGCGAAALLLLQGVPLQLTILVAIPGTMIVWWLTYRYFGEVHARQKT